MDKTQMKRLRELVVKLGRAFNEKPDTIEPLKALVRLREKQLIDKIVADDAILLPDADDIKIHGLQRARPGLVCEFGVFRGKSVTLLAKHAETVHGFDSFEGFPDEDLLGTAFDNEAPLNLHGVMPEVPGNVILHKGWYNESLPKFFAENSEQVGYLGIDCDLYSSTSTVLNLIADRINPGTVIYFDEFFNFPRWQFQEWRAWHEFVRDHNVQYTYLAFGTNRSHSRSDPYSWGSWGKVCLRVDSIG